MKNSQKNIVTSPQNLFRALPRLIIKEKSVCGQLSIKEQDGAKMDQSRGKWVINDFNLILCSLIKHRCQFCSQIRKPSSLMMKGDRSTRLNCNPKCTRLHCSLFTFIGNDLSAQLCRLSHNLKVSPKCIVGLQQPAKPLGQQRVVKDKLWQQLK